MVNQLEQSNSDDVNKPLTDYNITDLETFNATTLEPRWVAGLYFYSILDCLVELAYAASEDFFKRPYLYTNLRDPQIPSTLAKLRGQYGSNEIILAIDHRDMIYNHLFGFNRFDWMHDEGEFPRLRNGLLDACAAFSERVYDTGVRMLLARVRTEHRSFKEYLMGLQGDSVQWSRENALGVLTEKIIYPILRNLGVNAVFGIVNPPKSQWPYILDSNADKFVKEISEQLMVHDNFDMYITRERFSNLQRTALRGAEALATIMDFDEGNNEEDLLVLITKCYTWRSALMSLSNYSIKADNHFGREKHSIACKNESMSGKEEIARDKQLTNGRMISSAAYRR